jgi:hypothetical protein
LLSIIKNEGSIAKSNNKEDIKFKLKALIVNTLETKAPVFSFGDYFGDEDFKKNLEKVLS